MYPQRRSQLSPMSHTRLRIDPAGSRLVLVACYPFDAFEAGRAFILRHRSLFTPVTVPTRPVSSGGGGDITFYRRPRGPETVISSVYPRPIITSGIRSTGTMKPVSAANIEAFT